MWTEGGFYIVCQFDDVCLFTEHFHYIKRMIGADYVGIGGDFDGVNR